MAIKPTPLALHVLSSVIFGFGIYRHYTLPDSAPSEYGGKLVFLTFINEALLVIFYFLSVINDLIGSNEPPLSSRRSKLQRFRDTFFVCIIFPTSVFVVVTFWAIYAVDRELVFPRILDKYIPSWLNHIMHTAPVPCILTEMSALYHEYPSRRTGLMYTIGFVSIYQVWIVWIAYAGGFWVYPILEAFSWGQRLVFFILLWCLVISIYIMGESLNKFLWRRERAIALKAQKKKS